MGLSGEALQFGSEARSTGEQISVQYLGPLSYICLWAYSLYLLHRPLQEIMNRVMEKRYVNVSAAVLVFCLAPILWTCVERPLIGLGQRNIRYPRGVVSKIEAYAPQKMLP